MTAIDIRQTISDLLGVEVTDFDGGRTFGDLGLSSRDIVVLLVAVEDALGRNIKYQRLARVETVDGLEELIAKMVSEGLSNENVNERSAES